MAEVKPSLRKPVFTKRGLPLVIRHGKCHIAECLVGDETGMIIFTARNEQVNLMKEGNNPAECKDRHVQRINETRSGQVGWCCVAGPVDITMKEDNNLSQIESDAVNIVEE
uniref:Single-stranded DNA binding protein Ssb-like OB fold domain-containing protein n=1 Tax=Arabidopsis halleri subsp. halleri TaxID=81971 RepID=I0J3F9_ARAHH|nr:unknown [Arabidopsis halleri subsp. halleri]